MHTLARLAPYILAPLLAVSAVNARADRVLLVIGGAEKQIYLPATLADRLGYFRDEQLDVNLESEHSGVSAADALLTGAAQGVIGGYDHTIDLQAKGKSVVTLVVFTISPGEVQLVSQRKAAEVLSPADLRGRPLGVTGLGSSTAMLTQYLALTHGAKPNEIKLVPVGSGEKFIEAMRSARVHAGMTTEPTASRMIHSGEARMLVDLRTPEATHKALGGLYPLACLYVRTDWLATHRPQAQKLANALVKALRFISTRSAAEIAAVLPDDYFAGNRAIYVQSLAQSKSMFTPDGFMPPAAPASVLRVMSVVNRDLQVKRIDLRQTYTSEFVNAVP